MDSQEVAEDLVLRVVLETKVSQVLRDHLVPRDLMDRLEHLGRKDRKEILEHLELMDSQVPKVCKERQVLPDSRAALDPPVRPE